MVDHQKNELAPEDEPNAGPSLAPKVRQALSKSRRELTEEELNQSGVRLMLQDEVDRLDSEVTKLSEFREKFYQSQTRIAVFETKKDRQIAFEVIYGVCVAIGVGMVMLAPTIEVNSLRWTDLAIAVVLITCGIVAKVKQQ
jgi:hypothetical protein